MALTLVEFQVRAGWAAGAVTAGHDRPHHRRGRHWTVQLAGPGRRSATSRSPTSRRLGDAGGKVYRTTDGGAVWHSRQTHRTPRGREPCGRRRRQRPPRRASTTGEPEPHHRRRRHLAAQRERGRRLHGALTPCSSAMLKHGWAVGRGGEILETTDGGGRLVGAAVGHIEGPARGALRRTPRRLGGRRQQRLAEQRQQQRRAPLKRRRRYLGGSRPPASRSPTTSPASHSPTPSGAGPPAGATRGDLSSGFILHTTDGGPGLDAAVRLALNPTTRLSGISPSTRRLRPTSHDGWAVGETRGDAGTQLQGDHAHERRRRHLDAAARLHPARGRQRRRRHARPASPAPAPRTPSPWAPTTTASPRSGTRRTAADLDEGRAETRGRVQLAYLTDVVFGDATHGWAISDGSIEIDPFTDCRPCTSAPPSSTTTDGGATWTRQDAGDAERCPSTPLSFVSPTQGWVAGDGGDILTTTTGGNAPRGTPGCERSQPGARHSRDRRQGERRRRSPCPVAPAAQARRPVPRQGATCRAGASRARRGAAGSPAER